MNLPKCTPVLCIFILSVTLFQVAKAQESSEGAFISNLLYGIRFGLLAHDVGGLWSHSRAEGGIDLNAEIVFKKPSVEIWHGIIRPNLGVSINSQGGTSKAYGGLLWEFLFDNGYFVNSGVGLAVHDGQLESKDSNKKQLGSRVLFRIPFEFGFTISERHRISIMFDHVSNAYLTNPNEGMDTIGVRYGYQF
jgi:lipid A 3-O-deacylase